MKNGAFNFWNTFFRSRDIQVSQKLQITVITHEIEKISKNIGVMIFRRQMSDTAQSDTY